MVVLSVGMLANPEASASFVNEKLELDQFSFVQQTDMLANPAKTSIEGVFVAGTASAPMDIPDSILSGGAASAQTISYLRRATSEY
jgi:heterodisulfide reductase subunit A